MTVLIIIYPVEILDVAMSKYYQNYPTLVEAIEHWSLENAHEAHTIYIKGMLSYVKTPLLKKLIRLFSEVNRLLY